MAPKFSMAPASKSGMRDEVEFLEREVNGEVVVVIVQGVFGDIERVGRERDFVGRGADAQFDAVLLAAGALEVAHQESDEIGGHLGRGAKATVCLPAAGPRRVRSDGAVRDGGVAGVDGERDVVSGLEGRLVEAGEGAARVGGLRIA